MTPITRPESSSRLSTKPHPILGGTLTINPRGQTSDSCTLQRQIQKIWTLLSLPPPSFGNHTDLLVTADSRGWEGSVASRHVPPQKESSDSRVRGCQHVEEAAGFAAVAASPRVPAKEPRAPAEFRNQHAKWSPHGRSGPGRGGRAPGRLLPFRRPGQVSPQRSVRVPAPRPPGFPLAPAGLGPGRSHSGTSALALPRDAAVWREGAGRREAPPRPRPSG